MARLDALDALDLLPQKLRALSLSDCEVVLPYEEAILALDLFVAARWGLLAWEGWVKYPSGVGHHSDYQGTVGLTRRMDETWDDFVRRSAEFCRKTMQADQQRFGHDAACQGMQLYFCFTVTPPIAPTGRDDCP
jgi:hypothetical protein